MRVASPWPTSMKNTMNPSGPGAGGLPNGAGSSLAAGGGRVGIGVERGLGVGESVAVGWTAGAVVQPNKINVPRRSATRISPSARPYKEAKAYSTLLSRSLALPYELDIAQLSRMWSEWPIP